ncbi:MAG: hypothetical protein AAF668_13975 [Pseudomonadota bacterium]
MSLDLDRLNAGWRIVGIVKEKRTLTSKKNTDWKGYLVTLATVGEKYETNVEPDVFERIIQGEAYESVGTFEEFNGNLRLKCVKANLLSQAAETEAKGKGQQQPQLAKAS